MSAEIALHKLSLSQKKLSDLDPDERYAFAIAGHVFNETMLLQKLVLISPPPNGSHQFIKDASVGSAIFALRILIGKTEEAMKMLTKDSVESVLRHKFFTIVDGLEARWDAANVKYKELPWLGRIRNSRSFHYMNAAQWSPHLLGDICQDAYVIVGQTHGNTFFHWQEMAAALPMMKLVNEKEPFEGLATILQEMGALLNDVGSCLADGMQAFMRQRLTDDDSLGDAETITVPNMKDTPLNYFYAK